MGFLILMFDLLECHFLPGSKQARFLLAMLNNTGVFRDAENGWPRPKSLYHTI